MRAGLVAAVMFLGAGLPAAAGDAHAQAGQPGAAPAPLRLNLGLETQRPSDEDDLRLRPPGAQMGESAETFSVGPLRTRLGGNDRTTSIAHYDLDGMDLFGGGISGRVDGRGAHIYVRWPPGGDE